ncbi:MAG TPA: penicillin-binding protein, partial [Bacteroidaceae bacterium]|nr:penicillin-binding protein [Bacteroidaceae bacterium]
DNHSDSWFVGYTPDLVAGCWVGGEDRDIHFDTMEHGQGAHAALPLWGIFMEQVYADSLNLGYSPSARFEMPENYDPCAEYPSAAEEPDSYIIERF